MKVRYSLIGVVFLFAAGLLFAVSSEANIDPGTIAGMWLFNEDGGDIAEDSSGNGNNGSLINGAEWDDGKFDSGVALDGAATYINCGNGPSLDITEEITIVSWAKFDAVDYKSSGGDLFSIGAKGYPDSESPHAGWWFSHDNRSNGQSFNYTCFGNENGGWSGGGNNFSGQNYMFTNDEWYHLAITVGDSIGKLYINGEQLGAEKPFSNLVLSDTSMNLSIGSANGDWGFSGVIDEFAIFNVELEEEDIQAIMNEGLERASNLIAVDSSSKITTTWAKIKVQ